MSSVSSEPSVPPTISGAPIMASRMRVRAGAIADRTGSDADAGSASKRVRPGHVHERERVRPQATVVDRDLRAR